MNQTPNKVGTSASERAIRDRERANARPFNDIWLMLFILLICESLPVALFSPVLFGHAHASAGEHLLAWFVLFGPLVVIGSCVVPVMRSRRKRRAGTD